ncbi:hypothetical protein Desti_0457 [Desulfomonile tiedjei DSM 6799]|uniref:Uncharacterized protein n=2 Tax=Desulfomonile tiedjei TaxID=2358 RepID=I4C0V1_DESTA|nr:hypothetical protein Desti_0457 [Desulfomonile tiedjei DSM 6799]
MFGWNVRRVAEDFIADRMSKENLPNVIASWLVVICPIFLFVGPRDPWSPASGSIVQWLVSMIILYVGLKLCFKANEKGDARDFIERFIVLGARVGMNIACFLAFPILMIRSIVEIHWGYSFGMYSTPIIQIIFFWQLHHWIGLVSQGKLASRTTSSDMEVNEQNP